MKKGNDMTNHENLSKITGEEESVEVEAVKMLLAGILEDYEKGYFESNYPQYFSKYKSMVEWLNSEVEK